MAIRAEEIEIGVVGVVDLDRDRSLVLRHQRGDVHAFDELYRRYHQRLVAYCQRRVGDRHVAEELAQEAFVRALRALPTFAGERRFYPWIVVIAQRLCIDHHRRSARVEPAEVVDIGWVEADHDALWDAVDHSHLAAAVERLAPRHREILELREQRGWSYQRLADHLGVPLTTIEALLHRARKALRREYAAVAGEDAGRLAAFGGVALLLARGKSWLAALRPEQLAPGVAAAALAGVAVIGVTALPDPPADPGTGPARLVTVDHATPSAQVAPRGVDAAPPPTTAATVAAGLPASTALASAPADRSRPASTLEIGPVGVFTDDAGQDYVDAAVEEMPIVLDLGLLRVGVNPDHLLGLELVPGEQLPGPAEPTEPGAP